MQGHMAKALSHKFRWGSSICRYFLAQKWNAFLPYINVSSWDPMVFSMLLSKSTQSLVFFFFNLCNILTVFEMHKDPFAADSSH